MSSVWMNLTAFFFFLLFLFVDILGVRNSWNRFEDYRVLPVKWTIQQREVFAFLFRTLGMVERRKKFLAIYSTKGSPRKFITANRGVVGTWEVAVTFDF